jgi:alkanesulfonate monooxygenase SsuD/methylene tetrahydromethanopterin reductase-like flavin-dependent oxidoreductase (luciferase family)
VRVGSAVVNLTLTHPLRFAERASVLDHVGGGRVDICVGRGYQWPQNVVLQMDEDTSRELFIEALEIILAAWDGQRHAHHGKYFDFPEVQIFPPAAPAGQRGPSPRHRGRHEPGPDPRTWPAGGCGSPLHAH